MIARLQLAFLPLQLWHPALYLPPLPGAASVAVTVAHRVELARAGHLPTRAHVQVPNRAWRAEALRDVDGEGVTRRPLAAAQRFMSTAVRRCRR